MADVFPFQVGSLCFARKQPTELLATPERGAAVTGKADWATKFKVLEVQGRWLKVTDNRSTGWVFSGNVGAEKPPAENKSDLAPATAGATTASIAARPLSPSAKAYADRTSNVNAAADVEWVEQTADAVTAVQVESYMQEHKLGDYGV
jgi:hypothetical protein